MVRDLWRVLLVLLVVVLKMLWASRAQSKLEPVSKGELEPVHLIWELGSSSSGDAKKWVHFALELHTQTQKPKVETGGNCKSCGWVHLCPHS